MLYVCSDGNCPVEIDAASAHKAAKEYVTGAEWGNVSSTFWVNVGVKWVDHGGEECFESFKITVDPDEPTCEDEKGHNWRAPYRLVGGLPENPGVFGIDGAGIVVLEACLRCGCGRRITSNAQDPTDGTIGHTAIEYNIGQYSEQL